MDDEKIETSYIPVNFETGINILGKTISLIALIEGIILFTIFGVSSFLIMKSLGIEMATIIGFSACIAAPPTFLAITGINDEPLHSYVLNVLKYLKRKRIAYYNPRVKFEARAIDFENLSEENTELLPREKILNMYDQFKNNIDKKNRDKAIENNSTENDSNMYFEDDQGILNRPDDTYTDKELKAIKKAENAFKKKQIKEQKKLEKQKRKEQLRREKEIEDNF